MLLKSYWRNAPHWKWVEVEDQENKECHNDWHIPQPIHNREPSDKMTCCWPSSETNSEEYEVCELQRKGSFCIMAMPTSAVSCGHKWTIHCCNEVRLCLNDRQSVFPPVRGSLLSQVNEFGYDSIVLSGHPPISLTLYGTRLVWCPPRWCLKTKWLQDPKFIECLGVHIEIYFHT